MTLSPWLLVVLWLVMRVCFSLLQVEEDSHYLPCPALPIQVPALVSLVYLIDRLMTQVYAGQEAYQWEPSV